MDDKFGISTKNRSRKNFQNLEYAEFLRSLNLLTLETSENSVAFSRTSFRVMVIRLTIHGYGPPKRLSENSTNSWRRRLSDILICHQLGWLPKASVGYAFATF